MHYGNPPHIPGADDRVMIACDCGWISGEMTVQAWHALGLPWYCDGCESKVSRFVRYAPHERGEAMLIMAAVRPGYLAMLESMERAKERRLRSPVDFGQQRS
jgi:hypothetical protein